MEWQNKSLILLLSLLIGTAALATAQDQEGEEIYVRIGRIQSEDFPRMKVYVSVEDKEGNPNQGMVKGNFSAKVDTEDPVASIEVDPFKFLEEPVHYVFLLSVSGLMDGAPLAAQQEALLRFSENLREQDTLSAYLVGDRMNELFSYVSPVEVPEDAVRGVAIDDSPAKIYDSIVSVARKVDKDKSEQVLPAKDRVVFLLISDGRDQESRYTVEQTLEVLSKSGIPVYSIGLRTLTESSLSILNELSNQSGGAYKYTRRPSQITDNLASFAQRIQLSYVLRFRVKGVPADDSYHQLMIQVDNKNQSTQAFQNFLAVKNPFPLWLKITILSVSFVLLLLIIFLLILRRIRLRKSLGISKRRCPDCKQRMKDDWEFCPFCRYLPPKKKRGRKKDDES